MTWHTNQKLVSKYNQNNIFTARLGQKSVCIEVHNWPVWNDKCERGSASWRILHQSSNHLILITDRCIWQRHWCCFEPHGFCALHWSVGGTGGLMVKTRPSLPGVASSSPTHVGIFLCHPIALESTQLYPVKWGSDSPHPLGGGQPLVQGDLARLPPGYSRPSLATSMVVNLEGYYTRNYLGDWKRQFSYQHVEKK